MTDHHPLPPPDGHAGDLVSAHIDGELDAGTSAWVEQHLDECPGCRAEAQAAAAARAWVRDLPEADGTSVVRSLLARHRALLRVGGAYVAAVSVAAISLGVTASVLRADVVPDVDDLVAAHQAATAADDEEPPAMEGTEAMGDLRPVERVGRPYAAPPAMLGNRAELSRRALFDGDDLTVVVYGDGTRSVSVYEQPGRLDWDGLAHGDIVSVGDRRTWFRAGEPTVAVVEVGDLVVTVVSEDRAAALTVVDGLPARRRGSTFDRVHDACQRFTKVFALEG